MELMKTLITINFPQLNVESIEINNIREREFVNVISYIRDNGLIQDSQNLLGGKYPRSSVVYEIDLPNQQRKLNFGVQLIRDGNIYVGRLETRNSRKGIFVARLYNMEIRK